MSTTTFSLRSNRLRVPGLLLLVAFQCAAAGPPGEAPRAAAASASRAPAAMAPTRATGLASSLLDPTNEKKVHVSSTDSGGNCPAGSTKIDKCSGVYPNGNSWEISPCCRTVSD